MLHRKNDGNIAFCRPRHGLHDNIKRNLNDNTDVNVGWIHMEELRESGGLVRAQ
jgi:hypothetical protein